jgi:hypothetical protein
MSRFHTARVTRRHRPAAGLGLPYPQQRTLIRDTPLPAKSSRTFCGNWANYLQVHRSRPEEKRPSGPLLFNEQQPALFLAIEGIHGGEQAGPLDQPWFVIRIDVKNKH